jgi:ADP-ribose pyrophosphatase YjhB (NUDIX family)
MDYEQKYLKYKEKYLELKKQVDMKIMVGGDLNKLKKNLSMKMMIGGNLDELVKQIPANFPKQRTQVPDNELYKYTNGTLVSRFIVPLDKCSWESPFPTYSPYNYTSDIVLYQDILQVNIEDLSYREYNPRTKLTGWVKRLGWADPVNINALIPIGTNGKRQVGWSTKTELDKSNEFMKNCIEGNKENKERRIERIGGGKRGNEEMENNGEIGDKEKFRLCVKQLVDDCVKNGIKLRYSYTGLIKFNDSGYPINPIGRTGLIGRGTLGNWGPNHAADPVVCRANSDGILEFVLIKRSDGGGWGLPGGMVEAGQTIAGTRTREFAEEALASDRRENESETEYKARVAALDAKLKILFSEPKEEDILYQGVSDDPRNTDNSWMETVAILTILTGTNADLKLEAGDDAYRAKWIIYDPTRPLFASHKLFIDLAIAELIKRNLIREKTETGQYIFI